MPSCRGQSAPAGGSGCSGCPAGRARTGRHQRVRADHLRHRESRPDQREGGPIEVIEFGPTAPVWRGTVAHREGVGLRCRWSLPVRCRVRLSLLGVGRLERALAPRKDSVDLDIEREAQQRSDDHDHFENPHAHDRRLHGDGADEVSGDKNLTADQ
jgi:hypothetical protein